MHEISVTIIPKRHQILKFNLLKSEYISGAYTSSIILPKSQPQNQFWPLGPTQDMLLHRFHTMFELISHLFSPILSNKIGFIQGNHEYSE